MVQTAFTWRYGGNQVFLCGSFNGWSERIPMVLVEGSATLFQKIIDLPPGCYQYKFLVDGAWLVDQQQICDPDEYGTINNIVLVTGTELMSPEINAEALQPSSSTLIAGSMGSSSRGLMNEPVPQLSDHEMDLFYQVLSTHLLSSTIYELIPNSGKTFTLDVELEFEQAYHVMYEQGLVIVPLWDEGRSQMDGMLTASDFILILLQLHRNRAMFANEIRTVSSWKNWKLQLHRDIIGTLVPLQRQPLIHAGPDDSLGDVASKILQNNISTIPIIDSVNGSCPRLLHVACLAGILKRIFNIILDICLFYGNQLVTSPWVHGQRKLEKQVVVCC